MIANNNANIGYAHNGCGGIETAAPWPRTDHLPRFIMQLSDMQKETLRDAVVDAVYTGDLQSARRHITGFPGGFQHEQFQTVVMCIPEHIRIDVRLKGEGGTLLKRWANHVCGVTDHHKASYTHEEVMRAIRAIDAAHLKRKNDQDAPNKLTAKEVCASTLLGKGRSCGCRLQRTMLPHGVLIMHARDAVHYARALICWCPPVILLLLASLHMQRFVQSSDIVKTSTD